MKKAVFTLLLVLQCLGLAFCQDRVEEIKVNNSNFGRIENTKGQFLGTAFIAVSGNILITCLHVVSGQYQDSLCFISCKGDTMPIKLRMTIEKFDIAVFNLGLRTTTGQPLGDFSKIRPGDEIVYLGYDQRNKAFVLTKATVERVGEQYSKGCFSKFIEFVGIGIPGYSGGPIFDVHGRIVAIMNAGWIQESFTGQRILINRGISIDPITLQANSVFY